MTKVYVLTEESWTESDEFFYEVKGVYLSKEVATQVVNNLNKTSWTYYYRLTESRISD
jgi:hypothetical protein